MDLKSYMRWPLLTLFSLVTFLYWKCHNNRIIHIFEFFIKSNIAEFRFLKYLIRIFWIQQMRHNIYSRPGNLSTGAFPTTRLVDNFGYTILAAMTETIQIVQISRSPQSSRHSPLVLFRRSPTAHPFEYHKDRSLVDVESPFTFTRTTAYNNTSTKWTYS